MCLSVEWINDWNNQKFITLTAKVYKRKQTKTKTKKPLHSTYINQGQCRQQKQIPYFERNLYKDLGAYKLFERPAGRGSFWTFWFKITWAVIFRLENCSDCYHYCIYNFFIALKLVGCQCSCWLEPVYPQSQLKKEYSSSFPASKSHISASYLQNSNYIQK